MACSARIEMNYFNVTLKLVVYVGRLIEFDKSTRVAIEYCEKYGESIADALISAIQV